MKVWVIGRAFPKKENNMTGSFEFEQAEILAKHGLSVVYLGINFISDSRWGKCKRSHFEVNGVKVFDWDFSCLMSFPSFGERLLKKVVKRNKTKEDPTISHDSQRRNSSLFNFRQLALNFFFKCKDCVENILWHFLLKKVVKKYGLPNVIHIHYPTLFNYYRIKNLQSQGVRIVVTEHWTKVLIKKLTIKQYENLKLFAEKADAFICVGEPLKESIISLTKTKKEIYVIPNIVSPVFQYREQSSSGKEFVFIAIGRLVKVKQFDMIIKAFHQAFKEIQDVKLHIVGGGEEYCSLQILIKELGLERQVRLLGVKSRIETAEELQKSNALVCASRLETFGVPIIEAMACGKPVIGTDKLGFLEYMDTRFGYIVSSNDINQLSNAMVMIYKKRNQYVAQIIANYAQVSFGAKSIAKKLIQLYQY